MNKEIMKKLSSRYDDIDEEIKEFIKKKNHEREHATEVAEACQKAYDKFIEALKGVIGDNSEHKEDEKCSDKFIIKDSMTGNPVYEYRISVLTFFRSDTWVDDDDYSYYDASKMRIYLHFASPLAEYYGETVFEYKRSPNKGEMIFKSSSELESNITFAYPFRIRVGDGCHEVFNRIQKSDKFSWEHLAQYQCQMLKLELALDDYNKLYNKSCRFRITCDGNDIPKAFINVFDRLTALSNRDGHGFIDIENLVMRHSPMMVKIRIRECAELIKSALPFMNNFHTPHFKQRLLWMVEDACKLGLHEDQLIITEFVNTIPDPSDKWEL